MRFPVSVKGVLLEDDRVVLLLNERDEWELPGGRLERGEDPVACLEREFAEELGAEIVADGMLDCWLYQPLPRKRGADRNLRGAPRGPAGVPAQPGAPEARSSSRLVTCRIWICRKATAVRSGDARRGTLSLVQPPLMAEARDVLFGQPDRDVRGLVVVAPAEHLAALGISTPRSCRRSAARRAARRGYRSRAGGRSARATRRTPPPSRPTARRSAYCAASAVAGCARVAGSSRSILFSASISPSSTGSSRPRSASTASTSLRCASLSG